MKTKTVVMTLLVFLFYKRFQACIYLTTSLSVLISPEPVLCFVKRATWPFNVISPEPRSSQSAAWQPSLK